MRRSVAIAAVVAATLAGCGGDGERGDPRPRTDSGGSSLAPVPRAAVRRCVELGPRRDIPVLCPVRLTPGRWHVRYQKLRRGRREYLCNLETQPPESGEAFHVLAGGRSGHFSLRTTAAGEWPRKRHIRRDLGLIGEVRPRLVRRTTVGPHPALLLRVAGYPDGGVHGGHLAVVWNQYSAGYTLSIHFAKRTRRDSEATLLRAAVAMSRGR